MTKKDEKRMIELAIELKDLCNNICDCSKCPITDDIYCSIQDLNIEKECPHCKGSGKVGK